MANLCYKGSAKGYSKPPQEMQATLEKEQKADEDMYAELRGWCKDDVSSVLAWR